MPLLALPGDKAPEERGEHEIRVVDDDPADVGLVEQRAVELAGSVGDSRRRRPAQAGLEQRGIGSAHARKADEQPCPGDQPCERRPERERTERRKDGRRNVPAQAAGQHPEQPRGDRQSNEGGAGPAGDRDHGDGGKRRRRQRAHHDQAQRDPVHAKWRERSDHDCTG